MKKVLSWSVVILLIIGAFIGGHQTATTPQTSLPQEELYRTQLTHITNSLIESMKTRLQQGVKQAAVTLGKDREFVLAYFVDKDYSSRSVADMATTLGELITVDGFEIFTATQTISSFGQLPAITDTLDNSQLYFSDSNELWFVSSAESSNEITVRGWTKIDMERLASLSETLNTELILLNGSDLIHATISNIEQVNLLSSERLNINGVERAIISTPLSEEISLITLMPEQE